jgi:hypothetical protein
MLSDVARQHLRRALVDQHGFGNAWGLNASGRASGLLLEERGSVGVVYGLTVPPGLAWAYNLYLRCRLPLRKGAQPQSSALIEEMLRQS